MCTDRRNIKLAYLARYYNLYKGIVQIILKILWKGGRAARVGDKNDYFGKIIYFNANTQCCLFKPKLADSKNLCPRQCLDLEFEFYDLTPKLGTCRVSLLVNMSVPYTIKKI